MEVVHVRCAGLDISKKDAKVCVRVGGVGRRKATETVTTWGSTTSQILALREHLITAQVTSVVMEATGDYWNRAVLAIQKNRDCRSFISHWHSAETRSKSSRSGTGCARP